jgi:hypothetical protein
VFANAAGAPLDLRNLVLVVQTLLFIFRLCIHRFEIEAEPLARIT